MLIPAVEDGLESFLRAALPLPKEVGDISFEPPSGTWSAQVNRVTVNLFLYGVARSSQPPRHAPAHPGDDGRLMRREPLPMVQLSYLVSTWAGSTREQHQLLGDVTSRLIAQQVIPAEHLRAELSSSVQLALASDDGNRPRDLWASLGGTLRASFTLLVTVASDAFGWQPAAPGVTSVAGAATPVPAAPASAPRPGGGPLGPAVREDGGLVRRATEEPP